MKSVQFLSPEYLRQARKTTLKQRLEFLENFRLLHGQAKPERSRLISLRVPENLLRSFRRQAEAEGKKYQTKIKELMTAYLSFSTLDKSHGGEGI